MSTGIVKFLGGRRGEEQRVTLLLSMGFFMGVFLATLQVPAETLITALGSGYLDRAFLTGGVLGVIAAGTYVFLQRHISFSKLVVLCGIFIVTSMFVLRFAFYYIDYGTVSFCLFVMMGPLVSITTLSFWGIFGRLFDVRASKRIIGGIDTGQLSATCLAFFAISLVSDYVQTLDILSVSVVSSVGIFVVAVRIISTFSLDKGTMGTTLPTAGATTKSNEEGKNTISYLSLIRNRYFLALSVFLFCSVCVIKFNEFTYRSVMFTRYNGDEVALNKAYSVIDAIIIVVSFLIQSFLNDYIIGRYGLKISLMVMPVLLGLFTLGAVVSAHVFGYDIATEGYFIFFAFNVMGRIMATSLRDALENPTFKVYFFPVRERDRFDLQSRIEGVVNGLAILIVGIVLIALSTIVIFDILYFYYLLLGIIAIALYATSHLFVQYKLALQDSLRRQKGKLNAIMHSETGFLKTLSRALHYNGGRTGVFALKLVERIDPMTFRRAVVEALRLPFKQTRLYAYQRCVDIDNVEHLDAIKKLAAEEQDPELIEIAAQSVAQLARSRVHAPSEEEFVTMLRDGDYRKRKYAAQLLARFPGGVHVNFVIELARDVHPEVRRAAIVTAGLLKMPEYWSAIAGSLHLPAYTNACKSSLVTCGRAVFQTVDMLFYRTQQSVSTMLKVIQILGRLGGGEGMERIWKKLEYPNRRVFQECLSSLSYNSYRTANMRATRLKIQIAEQVGNIAWNLRVLLHVPRKHAVDTMITDALVEENKQHREDIFMTMAMVYDFQSVQLVKENVEFATHESLAYAVELMNIFLDEELKLKIFPLFDDLRPDERVEKLDKHYTPEFFVNYPDVLTQLINRDYNKLGRWTRGLALYRLASLPEVVINPDLIANIFNPDMFLLQVTAFVLYKKDKNEYRRQTLRIDDRLAKQLDRLLLPPIYEVDRSSWSRQLLYIERVIFLKQTPAFSAIDGVVLVELSEILEERAYEPETLIVRKGAKDQPLRIVLRGRIKKHDGDNIKGYLEIGDVIGLHTLSPEDEYFHDYVTVEGCVCLEVSLEKLFDLVGVQSPLLDAMINYVQEGGREAQLKRSQKQTEIESVSV